MEVLIETMAKEYFRTLTNGADAEHSECVTFEEDDGAAGYLGTHSSAISGEIRLRKDYRYLSESVFIKYYTTGHQCYDFDVRPSFENEVHFYRELRPFLHSIRSIDHLVPEFLASATAGDAIAIMMRRLGPEWVCHHMEFLDLEHMSLMMRKLGEFHAYSFAARQKDAGEFEKLANSTTNVVVCRQIPAYCPKLVAILRRALQPLRLVAQYQQAVARIDQILLDFANQVAKSFSIEAGAKFAVNGHLSYNQANVLFRYHNGSPVDLRIMDWQTPSLSPLGADLMRTLYSDTDRQTRDMHWDQLLDDYHEALSSTFDNCDTPSRIDILGELKRSVCAALFVLGHRVLALNKETASDGCKPSHPVWNDELLTDMFVDLIDRGLL